MKVLVLAAVTATVPACASGTATTMQPPPSSVSMSAGPEAAEIPVRDAQLTPGHRYRLKDTLPGIMDVELTAPDPPLYNYSQPDAAVLSTTADFDVDAVWLVDVTDLRIPVNPYFSGESLAGPDDFLRATAPAPADLLTYFAQLPFASVTQPIRPFAVAGQSGQAVDIRIGELPPEAQKCAQGSDPACGWLFLMPGSGQTVRSGQDYRILLINIALPHLAAQPLLITQNLSVPGAQAVIDDLEFRPPT